MDFVNPRHHRRSIRLPGYDYSRPGMYFVTLCAWNRGCIFGKIAHGQMRLNSSGMIVRGEWLRTSALRTGVELDEFVIMPNHFHGILCISDAGRGTARRAPTEQFGRPVAGSVPTVIRAFKSAVTKRVHEKNRTDKSPVWQRNYYECIVRSDAELNRRRQYIIDNPAQWGDDSEHPNNVAELTTRP